MVVVHNTPVNAAVFIFHSSLASSMSRPYSANPAMMPEAAYMYTESSPHVILSEDMKPSPKKKIRPKTSKKSASMEKVVRHHSDYSSKFIKDHNSAKSTSFS